MGEQVDSSCFLSELIDDFLATGPGAGEPLVLTPITRAANQCEVLLGAGVSSTPEENPPEGMLAMARG